MEHGRIRPPTASGAHLESDVMVPMRDGVYLATNILYPIQDVNPLETPLPVLLQRTPYNKSSQLRMEEARNFASQGYVSVIQDCRGRYASQGGFSKYVDEGNDGYDTIEWLARQPWCNGKIGVYGLSYAAHTQAALACLDPPHLACMWLDCGGFSNAFISGCRNGGAFELRQVTWAYREALECPDVNRDPVKKRALQEQNIHDWFQRLPWKAGQSPLSCCPDYESYLLEIWGHETFDEYWRQVGLCAEAHYSQLADVPQVHLGGWYDTYSMSTTDNYAALSAIKQGPVSLIMGPWTHGARSVSYAGDVDFGEQARVDGNLSKDYNSYRLAFFDYWLKGQETAWAKEPPVRIFVMGGGSGRRNSDGRLSHGGYWRSEDAWPLERAQDTRFLLLEGGRLSRHEQPGRPSSSRFLFDPNHPVPTIGGNVSSGSPILEPGGFNQQESPEFYGSRPPYLPLASRPDVLVFQTESLVEDTEVTGPISVHLWVSSTAPDTDFTAKLIDVYPPSEDYPQGYVLNITDGILRCKFRDSWEKPSLMEPGNVYAITIRLYPTSNLFARGHRIRLDISSSNFPRLDVNGNTGENPALSQIKVPAVNTVHHDPEHPSYLLLPLVPVQGPVDTLRRPPT
jgi:uncharacterized protein